MKTAALSLIWLIFTSSLCAGETLGGIRGIVLDRETGEPISDALIHSISDDRMTVSDSAGLFLLDSLRTGNHLLLVRAVGYQKLVRKGVEVFSSGVTEYELELDLCAYLNYDDCDPPTPKNTELLRRIAIRVAENDIADGEYHFTGSQAGISDSLVSLLIDPVYGFTLGISQPLFGRAFDSAYDATLLKYLQSNKIEPRPIVRFMQQLTSPEESFRRNSETYGSALLLEDDVWVYSIDSSIAAMQTNGYVVVSHKNKLDTMVTATDVYCGDDELISRTGVAFGPPEGEFIIFYWRDEWECGKEPYCDEYQIISLEDGEVLSFQRKCYNEDSYDWGE